MNVTVTLGVSQHDRVQGFKGAPQLLPRYAENHQPLGQWMWVFPVWTERIKIDLQLLLSQPESVCIYHFPINFEPKNGISSGVQIDHWKLYNTIWDSDWFNDIQKRFLCVYTQRNLFEILINQIEIRLYLPFTDWFGTKRTTVWFQSRRKKSKNRGYS